MYLYALKEIMRYQNLNSSVFLCFLDASKAFDRVNHEKLFVKLADRGIPGYLLASASAGLLVHPADYAGTVG